MSKIDQAYKDIVEAAQGKTCATCTHAKFHIEDGYCLEHTDTESQQPLKILKKEAVACSSWTASLAPRS